MPLGRMVAPVVVELGLGPLVSKAINSDFLERGTGMAGLEDVEADVAGIENPTTEDVGRVLRDVGTEDGDAEDEEVEEGRRRSAHDFLTVAGAGITGAEAAGGVEVGIGVESVAVTRLSWLITAEEVGVGTEGGCADKSDSAILAVSSFV